MTGRRSLLLAATLLSCGGVGAAENGAVSPAPGTETVDKIFASRNKPDVPGCALGVVKDGRTLYSAGYGMANIEHGIRNGPNTVFHIASVSKQFTAFAIQLLAQDGKLSLDDDVRKYLPELHDFGTTITIRNLIHHTSGLRDQWALLALAGWRLEDVITEADILNLVWRQKELNFPPGQEELYSNTGYTLLGVIVKRVSGKSLREFAAERIFQPLRMQNTRFQDDYGFVVRNRASSYGRQPDGSYRYIALSYSNVGATSLFTTIEDLARWDQNFYDASVGGQALLANMHVKGKLTSGKEINYASALVIGEYRGLRTVEHGGGDAAFRTILLRFPEQRFSVITLCNAGDANPTMLARAVADVYLAKELAPKVDPTQAPKPVEVKVDAKILQTYVGAYELMPGFVLTITLEDGQLKSQATGRGGSRSSHPRRRISSPGLSTRKSRSSGRLQALPLPWSCSRTGAPRARLESLLSNPVRSSSTRTPATTTVPSSMWCMRRRCAKASFSCAIHAANRRRRPPPRTLSPPPTHSAPYAFSAKVLSHAAGSRSRMDACGTCASTGWN